MSFLPTDIPDLRGYDSGVVLSNLSRLRTREERLGEQILAQLWELAGAVMQDAAGDPDTLTSILLALQSDREEPRAIPGQDVLPEYRTLLDRLRARDGLYARLVLYRYLDVRNPAGCCTVLPLRDVPPTVRGRVVAPQMPAVSWMPAKKFTTDCVSSAFCRWKVPRRDGWQPFPG